VLDFFDTIFMIARGQWAQFTFLHVYHHFSIFLTYWLVSNSGADGDVFYTVIANSFIHFVMYSYYALTTVNIRPSWGWVVTQAQLVQFVTMMSQGTYIVTMGCAYPHRVTYFYIGYILSLFLLFQQFNSARWGKKEKKGGAAKAE
jgi:elongation of very long chain fatty acids protein 4